METNHLGQIIIVNSSGHCLLPNCGMPCRFDPKRNTFFPGCTEEHTKMILNFERNKVSPNISSVFFMNNANQLGGIGGINPKKLSSLLFSFKLSYPDQRHPNEKKSKFIRSDFLLKIREEILKQFPSSADQRSLHIEITKNEFDPMFDQIALSLKLIKIDILDMNNWYIEGRSFALKIKQYHVTIAFYPQGINPKDLDKMRSIVFDTIANYTWSN